jgi:hypothetical protein
LSVVRSHSVRIVQPASASSASTRAISLPKTTCNVLTHLPALLPNDGARNRFQLGAVHGAIVRLHVHICKRRPQCDCAPDMAARAAAHRIPSKEWATSRVAFSCVSARCAERPRSQSEPECSLTSRARDEPPHTKHRGLAKGRRSRTTTRNGLSREIQPQAQPRRGPSPTIETRSTPKRLFTHPDDAQVCLVHLPVALHL